MELALVISADKWKMADEKTGEIREGATVHYINDYREDDEKSVGFKPTKISVSEEVFQSVRQHGAPALYNLDLRTRPGKESRPTLAIAKLEFVRGVELFGGN